MNWIGRTIVTTCDVRMKERPNLPAGTRGVVDKLVQDTRGKTSYASVALDDGRKVVLRLSTLAALTDAAKELAELRAEIARLTRERDEAREGLRDAEDRLGRVAVWDTEHDKHGRPGPWCACCESSQHVAENHSDDCPLHGWTRKTEAP